MRLSSLSLYRILSGHVGGIVAATYLRPDGYRDLRARVGSCCRRRQLAWLRLRQPHCQQFGSEVACQSSEPSAFAQTHAFAVLAPAVRNLADEPDNKLLLDRIVVHVALAHRFANLPVLLELLPRVL